MVQSHVWIFTEISQLLKQVTVNEHRKETDGSNQWPILPRV